MSLPPDSIPLHGTHGYNVVVETPRGSRTKFVYDAETGLFRARKLLAMGLAFPFAFGFLTSTRAGDGDPLDVLLLTDADLPTGVLVECRLVGAIAMEERAEGKSRRNDRLLAVPLLRHQDRPPRDLPDMPPAEMDDLDAFLVAYQAADGKEATVVGHLGRAEAEALVARAARERRAV